MDNIAIQSTSNHKMNKEINNSKLFVNEKEINEKEINEKEINEKEINEKFDIENSPYIEDPWTIIIILLNTKLLKRLICLILFI